MQNVRQRVDSVRIARAIPRWRSVRQPFISFVGVEDQFEFQPDRRQAER